MDPTDGRLGEMETSSLYFYLMLAASLFLGISICFEGQYLD